MPEPTSTGPRVAAQNDLYTVLLIAAASMLFIATIYLGVRSHQLFESLWPPAGG
jgi:hypothetical protein